ncbi:UPF0149 family protein [Methylomonas sp. LL1]|uniref:UPF0149 family protein n=1 Tax=Methylomonas sp. LL1 TaxID=2785785 RepID=UPI0018C362FE|nr:UPF0149 family protein [Methylomonas sp. LL1]QPK61573.1 UPF0149 family protein [Methylomonas sp. LL1]CAG1022792.1 hypothetical protein MTYM_01991 [Methylococcales bacterium]
MYQAVNAILEKYDADMGASEAHGIAVGMLCVEVRVDAANWLHELFADENDLIDDDKALMLSLFDRTRELLDPETEEFSFDLLLPDEDERLGDQVEALRGWCQGFLFGVGYAQTSAEWPGDSAEVMRDMIELTKIDSDVEGEEDEAALIELHEYVRAAVLTVRDQFADNKDAQIH